jgi:hypothetical protein
LHAWNLSRALGRRGDLLKLRAQLTLRRPAAVFQLPLLVEASG